MIEGGGDRYDGVRYAQARASYALFSDDIEYFYKRRVDVGYRNGESLIRHFLLRSLSFMFIMYVLEENKDVKRINL